MAELLSIQEVAQITGLHEITIRRYVHSGELEAVRIGRRIRVRREAVEGLMKPVRPGPEPDLQNDFYLKESAAVYQVSPDKQAIETLPEVVGRIALQLAQLPAQDVSAVTSGLAISTGTMTKLRTIAKEEGTTPQDLAETAIRRFLRYEARRRIQREEDAFRTMHAELRAAYPDQYVAVYRGKVADHDPDQLTLLQRVEERYPDAPVLIRQVTPEPEEVYTFRSPRVDEL